MPQSCIGIDFARRSPAGIYHHLPWGCHGERSAAEAPTAVRIIAQHLVNCRRVCSHQSQALARPGERGMALTAPLGPGTSFPGDWTPLAGQVRRRCRRSLNLEIRAMARVGIAAGATEEKSGRLSLCPNSSWGFQEKPCSHRPLAPLRPRLGGVT